MALTAIGQVATPMRAAGLLSLALCMAVAALRHWPGRRARVPQATRGPALICGLSAGGALSLAWMWHSPAAAYGAAIAFGALLGILRGVARRPGYGGAGADDRNGRAPPACAIGGAALACLIWPNPPIEPGWPTLLLLPLMAYVAAGASRGTGRGENDAEKVKADHPSPLGGAAAVAGKWTWFCARAVWLPMMAMPAMAQWCAAGAVPPGWTIPLHLTAMLMPAALVRLFRITPRSPAWAAIPMLAGVPLAWLSPGIQGLMTISLLHMTALSFVWAHDRGRQQQHIRHGDRLLHAVAAACMLALLGFAIEHIGQWALLLAHFVLGLIGGTVWLVASARAIVLPDRALRA